MKSTYLFQSKRLGFRNWIEDDLDAFALMNADEEVMEHFPKSLSRAETADFIDRLKGQFEENGYTYFATEVLETREFIGFIGLAYQDYVSDYTPAVDIGWRLKRNAWGRGYATEGAKQCLEFAFNNLNLERIISVCTERNVLSESVMKKIGMKRQGTFNHPKLKGYPEYEKCVCYTIEKEEWQQV